MLTIKYLLLPFQFNAERLKEEVNHLTQEFWQPHYQKLHYEGNWTAIPLRSIDGKADNIIISPLPDPVYADTVFLNSCPYIKEIISSFHCPIKSVRLLKLDAGAVIKEHRDAELSYEKGAIRIHIPVVTHEDLAFYLDNERVELKEGECWYMNFNLPHRVENKSPVDRIHLVIDADVNDWVKKVFENPDIKIKKTADIPLYDDATKKAMIKQLREMNTDTSNRIADEMEASIIKDSSIG